MDAYQIEMIPCCWPNKSWKP